MGGYGLVGIILDLEVDMVENLLAQADASSGCRPRISRQNSIAATRDPAIKMMYGRLNVARETFFSEALMVTYRAEPAPASGLPPVSRGGGVHDAICRASFIARRPAGRR